MKKLLIILILFQSALFLNSTGDILRDKAT